MQIDNIYETILMSWPNGMGSGKLCLIFVCVCASILDIEINMHNIQWVYYTKYYRNGKDLGLTINANMKVSEQYIIATAKGNKTRALIRRNIVYKNK